MPLLLQGVRGRVGQAVDRDGRGVNFRGLSLAGRRLDHARNGDAAAGGKVLDFRLVIRQAALGNHLDVAEARAVVDFQEAEAGLGVAAGADPAVERDFAFVVDRAVKSADILRHARAAEKTLIVDADVFDVYEGAGIAEGKKSVAISVTLQPRDKTLTEAEIEAVAARVVAEVAGKTGAVLRS